MIGQPKGQSLLVMSALAPISALQWEILRVRDESYCNFFIRNIKKFFFAAFILHRHLKQSFRWGFFWLCCSEKRGICFLCVISDQKHLGIGEWIHELISPVDTTGNRLSMKMFHFFCWKDKIQFLLVGWQKRNSIRFCVLENV